MMKNDIVNISLLFLFVNCSTGTNFRLSRLRKINKRIKGDLSKTRFVGNENRFSAIKSASGLLNMNLRIEVFLLDPNICGFKTPINSDAFGIAINLPGIYLRWLYQQYFETGVGGSRTPISISIMLNQLPYLDM
ncbi:MAG: hypothetical protein AB9907_14975 [Flexilinea sp.]